MENQSVLKSFIFLIVCIVCIGCATTGIQNRGMMPTYEYTNLEADWIRNGEPIDFEGELWYPQDGIEGLTDSEVLVVGEYRELKVFVDKVDVRPYERLYTKFGVNKYRYFEKQSADGS